MHMHGSCLILGILVSCHRKRFFCSQSDALYSYSAHIHLPLSLMICSRLKMLDRMEEYLDPERVIDEFEAMTRDVERVQEVTLKRILEENSQAEYLRKLGLNGRTDLESFRAHVPLVTHKDLEPYIQRIVDGDSSPILTGQPINTISLR